jgi:hypothetical protein
VGQNADVRADPLIAVLVEELRGRGISQPDLWAEVLTCGGVEEAAQRFAVVLADCLAVAKERYAQRQAMDKVWQSLVVA